MPGQSQDLSSSSSAAEQLLTQAALSDISGGLLIFCTSRPSENWMHLSIGLAVTMKELPVTARRAGSARRESACAGRRQQGTLAVRT